MPVAWDVRIVRSVSSTMDEIDTLATEGHREGVVVRAEEQTAGHGRAGRSWSVPAGSSLTFSLLLRPVRPATELGLMAPIVAHAVVSSVEAWGLSAQVKWPNDILVHGRKVAGILIRTRQAPGMAYPWVNVGVGLNVNIEGELLPESATSLQAECGGALDRDLVFTGLLDRLAVVYDSFREGAIATILSDLNDRLAYRGDVVSVDDGGDGVRGRVERIGARGELVLTLPDGSLREIVSGELVRGPRPVVDRA